MLPAWKPLWKMCAVAVERQNNYDKPPLTWDLLLVIVALMIKIIHLLMTFVYFNHLYTIYIYIPDFDGVWKMRKKCLGKSRVIWFLQIFQRYFQLSLVTETITSDWKNPLGSQVVSKTPISKLERVMTNTWNLKKFLGIENSEYPFSWHFLMHDIETDNWYGSRSVKDLRQFTAAIHVFFHSR